MANEPASYLVGFTSLSVAYPNSTHYIYAKKHTAVNRISTKGFPEGRTLFVVNLPPDATERDFVRFFKPAGTIEKVLFGGDVTCVSGIEEESDGEPIDEEMNVENRAEDIQDDDPPRKRRKVEKEAKCEVPKVTPLPHNNLRILRPTGGSAHIIFLDASSTNRALVLGSKPRPWPWATVAGDKSLEELSGLARYSAMYDAMRPPLDIVREHSDTSMELYEYELAQTNRQFSHRKGEAIIDEDGFELVTRGGAYGKTLGGGVAVASKKFQATGLTSRTRKTKNQNDKEGFYAFQKAEKQRREMIELKKNWEADKAKVEKLKEARKFKPY